MQIIDDTLLNRISEEAAGNERLRKNFNLHSSLDDKVQRLLNALEPGTILPVHRHQHTDETYFIVRGKLNVKFYDDNKLLIEEVELNPVNGKYGISIPAGKWHTVDVKEKGTVIFEVKEGPYLAMNKEDIL